MPSPVLFRGLFFAVLLGSFGWGCHDVRAQDSVPIPVATDFPDIASCLFAVRQLELEYGRILDEAFALLDNSPALPLIPAGYSKIIKQSSKVWKAAFELSAQCRELFRAIVPYSEDAQSGRKKG